MSDHRVYRIGPGGLPPGEHDAETDEGWSMAKLLPSETGLPMVVAVHGDMTQSRLRSGLGCVK